MNGPITIIIVNYNSGRALRKCLESVFCNCRGFSLNVIVVNNHSLDGSKEGIRVEFPDVINIRNDKNLGFAKGCNQGLELSSGDYVLFLNPDTIVKNDALYQCLEFMDSNINVGLLGSKLLNMDGTVQSSCADFPFLHKLLFDHILRNGIFSDAMRQRSLLKYWAHDRVQEVDWVLGAFMLVRLEVIRQLGGFDEDFFLYGEDMDLCYRVKQAGWKVVFFPQAEVFHMGNPVWDAERLVRVYDATLMFYRKHFSLPKVILLSLFMKVAVHLSWQRST